MGYSFYEIYITAQRALRAMGFPYGADEDAAFIIAWLELNNFKGVTLLQSLIPDLNQKYEGGIEINNLKEAIDFKNISILIKGPGLIDYMHSIFNNNKKISIKIKNCTNGIFFLPLLYKKSENIQYLKLNFYNSKNEIIIYEIINNEITYRYEKNLDKMSIDEIRITMDESSDYYNHSLNKIIISKKIIQENLSNSLSPEINTWNDISELANRTFVPESEESRNKGAGGGDDND